MAQTHDLDGTSLARSMGIMLALAAVLGALQPAAWGLGRVLNGAVSALVAVVWVAMVAAFAAVVVRCVRGAGVL